MFGRKAYLTLVLLLSWAAAASAQERVWNAALDWYEFVCSKCADWKDRVDRGESVPKDSLQLMAKELSAVKQNLQGAWGEMTPGQRLRFEIIRDRFASGRWKQQALPSLPAVPSLRNEVSPAGMELAPCPLQELLDWKVPQKPKCRQVFLEKLIGVTAGVYPDFSAGLMAGVALKEWGLLLKGRSSFSGRPTEYDCLSDGTTADGFFWSGNEKKVVRHQITLDISYAIVKPVSVYAGVGYGFRKLCWKDSGGAWARVADRSYSGLSADAGVLIRPVSHGPARGLTLLLGGSWIRGGYVDAEVGVGWQF